jgi:hypothetical protein
MGNLEKQQNSSKVDVIERPKKQHSNDFDFSAKLWFKRRTSFGRKKHL